MQFTEDYIPMTGLFVGLEAHYRHHPLARGNCDLFQPGPGGSIADQAREPRTRLQHLSQRPSESVTVPARVSQLGNMPVADARFGERCGQQSFAESPLARDWVQPNVGKTRVPLAASPQMNVSTF